MGTLRSPPGRCPELRICLTTVQPGPVPIHCLSLVPNKCPIIATYPVPSGPPRAGLPLPGSSQQGREEDTLLCYSVSSTQGQVWGQTSGLLELMLCALSLLQLPSTLLPRASLEHQSGVLSSGSGEVRRIIRGPLRPAASTPSSNSPTQLPAVSVCPESPSPC